MIVQHNMAAANTSRQLGKNVKVNQTWSERLASGYRINRAADDASGLAISEEMRAQIRGLNKGSTNCTEGISLLQTADAALVEVHGILDRIKELTVQSANDVNTPEDRKAIQHEVDCLLDEIDRIGNDTEFNTIKIFSGGESGLIGPDGNPITIDRIPFRDINLADITLGNRPFSGNNSTQLNLVAALDSNYTTTHGIAASWPLIYGTGNTSHPNFRVSYEDDSGNTVSANAMLTDSNAMRVDSYVYDAANSSCSRVFHYSPAPGVSFDITQKITVQSPPDAAYKYYAMSYTVENTGNKAGTVDFMFHTDTAYGGDHAGDLGEGYYINGNRVSNVCLYSDQYPPGSNIYNTGLTDFSIVNIKNALPFSENIRLDPASMPNTVAFGQYSQIYQWSNYDNIGTGNNSLGLGNSTGSVGNSIDLGFSLIWQNKVLAANGGTQEFSFQYGIVASQSDTNIPQDQLVMSGAGTVHTDTLNLWIQSGANSFDGMYITIGSMNSNVLNIRPLDVSTQPGAGDSNARTDRAIEKISLQRAGIGAYHNRLEHARSGDDITSENLQAAESRIRDLDIAEGMVNYARTNILMQAGQAMLAQANQATQGVAVLLQ